MKLMILLQLATLSELRKYDINYYEEKAFLKIYSVNYSYNHDYGTFVTKLTPVNKFDTMFSSKSELKKPVIRPIVRSMF